MNENRTIELLKEIKRITNGEYTSLSENIPLVSSTTYNVRSDYVELIMKVTKSANTSALNKRFSLKFIYETKDFTPFNITIKKSVLSIFSSRTNLNIEGNENQEITQYLKSEIASIKFYGMKEFKVVYDNNLIIQLKSTEVEPLMAVISLIKELLLKF